MDRRNALRTVGLGGVIAATLLAKRAKAGIVNHSTDEYTPTGSGSVVRDVGEKIGESVSIKDFGADESNSASTNSTSIQSAMDHVGAIGGGVLLFPRGIYLIDTSLTFNYDNICICGEGDATVIKADPWINERLDLFKIPSSKQFIKIENMTVDGNKGNLLGTNKGTLGLQINQNSGNILVSSVRFQNFDTYNYGGSAIRVNGNPEDDEVKNLVIENCFFTNCNRHSIWINARGHNARITGNYFFENKVNNDGQNAIYCERSENLKISENTIIGSGDMGIEIWHYCHNSIISNNIIKDVKKRGISVDLSHETTVCGNVIKNCGSDGIENAASERCVIDGNVVENAGGKGISVSALSGNTDHSIYSNNIITAPVNMGIQIYDSCVDSIIDGNIFNACGDRGVFINGSSKINISIVNNKITSCEKSGIYNYQSVNTMISNNLIEKNNLSESNGEAGMYINGGTVRTFGNYLNNNKVEEFHGIPNVGLNSIGDSLALYGHGSKSLTVNSNGLTEISGTYFYNDRLGVGIDSPRAIFHAVEKTLLSENTSTSVPHVITKVGRNATASSSSINALKITLGAWGCARVHLTYAQFNTGYDPDELYYDGIIILTAGSSSEVKVSAPILANNVTVSYTTSGREVTIKLNRTGGTSFKNSQNLIYAEIVSHVDITDSIVLPG